MQVNEFQFTTKKKKILKKKTLNIKIAGKNCPSPTTNLQVKFILTYFFLVY